MRKLLAFLGLFMSFSFVLFSSFAVAADGSAYEPAKTRRGLSTLVVSAEEALDSYELKSEYQKKPISRLSKAISSAKSVLDNSSSGDSEIETAYDELDSSMEYLQSYMNYPARNSVLDGVSDVRLKAIHKALSHEGLLASFFR